jgi:orotidine-5'-phosphate decarboxylase
VERAAICVGIDPHPGLLESWNLPTTAGGLEIFSHKVLESLGERVAWFKPQSAFFEAYGSKGIQVLERVLQEIRACGARSILDAKRGDIGSTMTAYAQAYLADDAPLRADALTLSPYLGFDSLKPALDLAESTKRTVFVLARTSNPEGGSIQLANAGGKSVAQAIVDSAQAWNDAHGSKTVGLVVGATHADIGVDLTSFSGPILAPGIGAQGATMADIPVRFGSAAGNVLPMVGRAILGGGPELSGLRDALEKFQN